MAVTLHSRLPFHLSRGDQERETSRLSLRHGRRRTSLVDDRLSSPFIADEINKRRRVSDRTFLSFPLLFHHFSLPFCLIIGSKTSSYLFMWQHHCDLVIISSPFWTTYPYFVIEYKENGSNRFDTILLSLFPFYFFSFFYGI